MRIRRSHAALAAAAASSIIIAACTDSPTAPKNAPPINVMVGDRATSRVVAQALAVGRSFDLSH